MKIILRTELPSDSSATDAVIKAAFLNIELSDQSEHQMVARLRKSELFIPELSIVAVVEGKIVGHVLLTPIEVRSYNSSHKILALAPISVLPEFQNKGIGSRLMNHCHEVAQQLDYCAIALIGHENYYPKFGYVKANDFEISFPFDVPSKNAMIKILDPSAFASVAGMIEYPSAFFG